MSEHKKILVITPFPPTKAPEADHAYYLCEELAEAGVQVEVLTTRGSVAARHPRITVHPVMRAWSWRELPRLVWTLRRVRPAAVLLIYVGWVYNHHPMITFAPTMLRGCLSSTPFVTLFDSAYAALVGNLHTRTVRAVRKIAAAFVGDGVHYNFGTLLRDSDCVLALSQEQLQALIEFAPVVKEKSALLPIAPLFRLSSTEDGAARQRRRAQLGVAPTDFLLAYFGYLYPGKGVETLLKALQIASQQQRNLRLAVVGGVLAKMHQDDSSAWANELKKLALDLGVAEQVVWAGGFSHDDTEASLCLRAADLCVLPFDSGVQLNHSSFAAAAAHGLPIITTRVETTAQVFQHAQNVWLCPPKDPGALAEAIQTMAASPALREHLSSGALRLAEEHFSWSRAVEMILAACSTSLVARAVNDAVRPSQKL